MIALDGVSVRAGAFALERIAFQVPAGGTAVLMGKTGSGKTTLLEAICGLRPLAAGRVVLGGREVGGLPPAERGIGYVPQDRALFHTMTVRENLGFALAVRRRPRAEIDARTAELAALLRIAPLLDRRPDGLSGGEAQRVALGRALAARPTILLLDEPLSALDDDTWQGMVELLLDVRRLTGVTTLHVTHRLEEAKRLSDRILTMSAQGVQEQKSA